MKRLVFDPFVSVRETGGCTFEPDMGWWTQISGPTQERFGRALNDSRDALYIPTLQKTGEPVDVAIVEFFKQQAAKIGLLDLVCASGMWVLSTTGDVQTETIWIARGKCGDLDRMRELTYNIKIFANQDCVAWEENGEMQFTGSAKEGKEMKKIWVVPRNDLEAVEIINLLHDVGETVIVSSQPWGASWEKLENPVVQWVEKVLAQNPDTEVVGVELAGTARWGGRTIDHHFYSDDDRSSEKSSIEQVAEELGVPLNRYQQLVAVNDKWWIPGLQKAGATKGEIETIRISDRCAQGITPDEEAQAVRDIQAAEWRGRKCIVRCKKHTSCYTDRMFGTYDELIVAAPDKWIYFGPRHHEINKLIHDAGLGNPRDWVGGGSESGFAGFISPSEDVQKKILDFFWK